VSKHIPADIRDELFMSAVMLPFAYTNIKAGVSNDISATDSTPSTGGACRAEVPSALAHALFRCTEERGEAVRLDWSELEEVLGPSRMLRPDTTTDALIEALPWKHPRTFEHHHSSHIFCRSTGPLSMKSKTG